MGDFQVGLPGRLDELERQSQRWLTEGKREDVAQLAAKLEGMEEELRKQQKSLADSVKSLEATCVKNSEAADNVILARVQEDLSALQRQRREMAANFAAKWSDLQELRDSQDMLRETMGNLEELGKRTLETQQTQLEAAFDQVQRDFEEIRSQQADIGKAVEAWQQADIGKAVEDASKHDPDTTGFVTELAKQAHKVKLDLNVLQSTLAHEIASVRGQQEMSRESSERQQKADLAALQSQLSSDMDVMRAQWQNDVEILRCMYGRTSENVEALLRNQGARQSRPKQRLLPDMRELAQSPARDEKLPPDCNPQGAGRGCFAATRVKDAAARDGGDGVRAGETRSKAFDRSLGQ
jgi:hypothetical protein